MSVLVFAAIGSGVGVEQFRVQVAPLSVLLETRTSLSVSMVPPRSSLDHHTATQFPWASVVNAGYQSSPLSVSALVFSGWGAVQLAPASKLRDTRMSRSVPIVSPRCSRDCQIATQVPARSVLTSGCPSPSQPEAALMSSAAGSVQLAPLSVLRANRMSVSTPIVPPRSSLEHHTAIQLPSPSVASMGQRSLPLSEAAFVLSATGGVQVAPLSALWGVRMSVSGPIVPPNSS
jgi:hypothetical protein